jgi:preprotein translocase subunit SecB
VSEQTKQTGSLKRIAPLIAAVRLKDIRLVEANVKTSVRSAHEVGEVELAIDKSAIVKEYAADDGMFWVLAKIHAQLIPVEPKKSPPVSIKATFELRYSMPKELKVSQAQLSTFARINSVFNVWPYWREFVQNMVARMNLPTLTLPVFRLEDTTKARRKKPTETH